MTTKPDIDALLREAWNLIEVLRRVDQQIYQGTLGPAVSQAGKDADLIVRLASALKAESEARIEATRLMSQYAREAGEATGRLEMSEVAGVVDDWRERAEKAEAENAELHASLDGAWVRHKTKLEAALLTAEAETARLRALLERAGEVATALCDEVARDEEHGDGAWDVECPLCEAHAAARTLSTDETKNAAQR